MYVYTINDGSHAYTYFASHTYDTSHTLKYNIYIYMYIYTYRTDKCCMHDIYVYMSTVMYDSSHSTSVFPSWENPRLYTACLRPPCRRRNTSREKISAAASC